MAKSKKKSSKKTRPGYTWRKGYTRSDGKRVKGTWVKKAAKKSRKANPRKPAKGGKVWRKGYTTKSGKRVAGRYVKKPRRRNVSKRIGSVKRRLGIKRNRRTRRTSRRR